MSERPHPDYDKLQLKDLNYESYLKIPDLLGLQEVMSEPAHPDEMFFIIIHQSAELWFRLVLHETETLISAFRRGSVSRAIKVLKRIREVLALQVKQIKLLSTLTPVEFAGFRDRLRPASGFQSVQFRKMEFTYGLRNQFFLKFFETRPEVVTDFQNLLKQPSVYDEFLQALKNAGYPVPASALRSEYDQAWEPNSELVEVLAEVYRNPKDNYHWVLLFETMIDVDEQFSLWRSSHLLMVQRAIGDQAGTGGSAGYNFLQSRLHHKFFPDLWDVRNRIGVGNDY